ncbi:MAG: hypothetical protein GX366_09000 [Epulopiscium sp.]|nr:hypothetical protein [Candidatus Epulonipiscium sp.]
MVGGGAEKDLGNISVGTKQHQVSWEVKVAPSSMDKVEKSVVTWIANNLFEINTIPLTERELKTISECCVPNKEGIFTKGLKIISNTTYTSSGVPGATIPVRQNSYSGWDEPIMYGYKYYKGKFSTVDKNPMWW